MLKLRRIPKIFKHLKNCCLKVHREHFRTPFSSTIATKCQHLQVLGKSHVKTCFQIRRYNWLVQRCIYTDQKRRKFLNHFRYSILIVSWDPSESDIVFAFTFPQCKCSLIILHIKPWVKVLHEVGPNNPLVTNYMSITTRVAPFTICKNYENVFPLGFFIITLMPTLITLMPTFWSQRFAVFLLYLYELTLTNVKLESSGLSGITFQGCNIGINANFLIPKICSFSSLFVWTDVNNVKLESSGLSRITFQGCRLHWSSYFLIVQLKLSWQYCHSCILVYVKNSWVLDM